MTAQEQLTKVVLLIKVLKEARKLRTPAGFEIFIDNMAPNQFEEILTSFTLDATLTETSLQAEIEGMKLHQQYLQVRIDELQGALNGN